MLCVDDLVIYRLNRLRAQQALVQLHAAVYETDRKPNEDGDDEV